MNDGRPCYVLDEGVVRPGMLHGFFQFSDGRHSMPVGIVEMAKGNIAMVNPDKISILPWPETKVETDGDE